MRKAGSARKARGWRWRGWPIISVISDAACRASSSRRDERNQTIAADDRRLLLRQGPLRDHVVSLVALHLQLHELSDGLGQRLRAQHAGSDEGLSHRQGRAEGLASSVAVGRRGLFLVLRRVR